MNACKPPVVSRADLIRLHNVLGPKSLPRIAAFTGYRRKAPPHPASPNSDDNQTDEIQARGEFEKETFTEVRETPHPSGPIPPVAFWRPISHKKFSRREEARRRPPRYYIEADPFEEREIRADRSLPPPPLSPLCPWPRLWPFLRDASGAGYHDGTLDIRRVVLQSARLQPMRRLPRLTRRSWARRCLLIVDCDTRLTPFWGDIQHLSLQLDRVRGRGGLERVLLEDGPFGPAHRDGDDRPLPLLKPPVPNTPILILSDLGLLGHAASVRDDWLRFGHQFRRAGCAPVVLTPAPRRKWTDAAAEVFRMACWDRGERLPKLTGPHALGSKPVLTDEANRRGPNLLLSLLSPAIRVEPELLRAARLLLPGDLADAGDEAEVWHHDHVRRSYAGFAFDPQHIGGWRQKFLNIHPRDLQQKLVDLIQSHHRRLSPAVYHEEQLIAAMLLNQPPPQEAERFFWRCLKTLDQSEYARKAQLEAYLQRVPHRNEHDPAIWKSEAMCALYISANRHGWTRGRLVLPRGMDPAHAARLQPEQGPDREYTLVQIGPHFFAQPKLSPTATQDKLYSNGSPIIDLISSDGVLQVRRSAENGETEAECQVINLESQTPVSVEIPPKGILQLKTTHQETTLEGLSPPPWALGWGRDAQGLFLILRHGEKTRKAYWFAPGSYPIFTADTESNTEKFNEKSFSAKTILEVKHGFWWDENEFEDYRKQGFRKPPWAYRYGQDDYGLYADFRIKEVTQRMRWIMPGEFLMGSPPSEPERESDEDQHKVIFTRSFWMAETACTQALWRTLMDGNPSESKGENLPVENVSFEDCQAFITRLNGAASGLEMGLPTEAQWEYACRAGTTTPFYFGETITNQQVNFDGGNYIPFESGHLNRTATVKTYPCNAWGLYEMHGNVLEWCNDLYGQYPQTTVVDPAGSNEGQFNVLRGGSWISAKKYVRSARRHRDVSENHPVGYEPIVRYDSYGLRLVRSQPASHKPNHQTTVPYIKTKFLRGPRHSRVR